MFAALRICRVLTGQQLVPQHFSIAHHRSGGTSEMAQFVGTNVQFGADTDEFALHAGAPELPLVHADSYLNDFLLKIAKRRWPKKKSFERVAHQSRERDFVVASSWKSARGRHRSQSGHEPTDTKTKACGRSLISPKSSSRCGAIWQFVTSTTPNCMYPRSRGCLAFMT